MDMRRDEQTTQRRRSLGPYVRTTQTTRSSNIFRLLSWALLDDRQKFSCFREMMASRQRNSGISSGDSTLEISSMVCFEIATIHDDDK